MDEEKKRSRNIDRDLRSSNRFGDEFIVIILSWLSKLTI